MSRHLKTTVINDLKRSIATFKQLPPSTPVYSKGVRYFVPCELYKAFWGAMNDLKEGRKRRKHIIVRHCSHRPGLLQLYTYHFPKTWSKACVANREIIKLAQRRAHALEHDTSREALEWRIRFFKHYFRVVKNHQQPEPGLKAYSRFYQYVYVCIYRDLKSALQCSVPANSESGNTSAMLSTSRRYSTEPSDVSFEPLSALSYYRQRHPTPALENVLRQKHSFADGERKSMSTGQYGFCGAAFYIGEQLSP